jgi:hypothetical protein
MPTFVFTDPSGKEHEVTGPEGATQEQAFSILQQQLKGSARAIPSNIARDLGPGLEGSLSARVGPRLKTREPIPFANPLYEVGRQLVKANPKNVVREGAAVLDIIGPQGVAQVTTQALGTVFGRAFAASSGITDRDEINRHGAEFGAELASNPLIDMPLTKLVKWISKDSRATTAEELMGKVTEVLGKGGEWTQEKSGGIVRKEDVDLLTSVLFARLGISAYGRLGARKASGPPGEPTLEGLNAAVDKFQSGVRAGSPEDLYTKAAGETPEGKAAKPEPTADFADLREAGMVDEFGNPIFPTKKSKKGKKGKAGLVDEYGTPLAVGVAAGGAALALGADPEEIALAAGVVGIPLSRRRKAVTDLLPEMSKVLDEAEAFGPSSLPKLDQIRMGLAEKGAPPAALAAFDDYVRGMEKLAEPLELPGFIFPVSHDPEKVGAALAVLPLAAIIRANPATPLREFTPRLRYTTRVLEMMTKELGDRATFTDAQVKGFLGRQGISGAEREMFAGIMEGKKEIAAKDLVAGVKERTGDFELTPKATDEFAGYGLANIGRLEEATAGLPDTGIERPQATTRIYQSPLELGTNNHFRDPNYFAHTRSFVEGGVSHVVEIQSDLAQKAGKRLTEGERAALTEEMGKTQALYNYMVSASREGRDMSGVNRDSVRAGADEAGIPYTPGENLYRVYERTAVKLNEIRAKLQGANADPIRPILKDWWKRIIREEVAGARVADPNAKVVRFATADTVAKVEGWPRINENGVDVNRARQLGLEADPQAQAPGRLRPEHQGIYDRYRGDIETFLRKEHSARDYTDPQGHTWLEVDLPPDATPIRLWGMGAAAAGAALTAMWLDGGDESTAALAALAATPVPKRGLVRRALGPAVVIGGAAALANAAFDKEGEFYYAGGAAVLAGLAAFAHHRSPQIRNYVENAGLGAEIIYGNMSTMLKGISPATLRRVRDFEWQNMVHKYESLKLIDKTVDGLLKLPRNVRDAVDIALFNNERGVALKLVPPALVAEMRKAFDFLDKEGATMLHMGLVKKLDPEYWPRVVKDLDGLFAQLEKVAGKKAKDFLEERLRDASGKKAKKTGDALNDMEMSAIINEHLQAAINRPDQPGQAGMLKKRTIKEVRQDILPFYETAADSIAIYAKSAAKEIERAKFFGKDLVKAKESNAVLLDASIGRVVKAERDAGRLTDKQLNRLEMILKARFGPGERSGNALSRTYRNIVQALLLGNPYSAMVQFGDLAVSATVHGYKSTIVGIVKALSRSPDRWGLDEMGLADHILNDFDTGTHRPFRVGSYEISTAKFLQRTLKFSGFSLVDSFSKLVNMNAAANRFSSLARTQKGRAEITRMYERYFGADLPQLIRDLQAGKKSRLVGELIFGELSDVQPLTMLDKPVAYAQVPSARPYLTMKGFMVKQIGLVWERGVREIFKGDRASIFRGASFLTRYAILMGLSGAALKYITQWVQTGQPPQEMPGIADISENVFKTFGWSTFAIEELKKDNPTLAAGMVAIPPWKLFDDIYKLPRELRKLDEGDPTANPRGVSYFPVVGKDIYLRALGGNERRGENEERRKRIEENRKLFESVGE